MTVAAKQIADIEIHGYLDGELSEQRSDTVERYLDQERAVAEQLVHFGVQGDLIRRLYGPLINRPMPPQIAGRCLIMNNKASKVSSTGRKLFLLTLMVSVLAAGAWFFLPTIMSLI